MSNFRQGIKDTKKVQLNILKDNLQDMELYLREIEHMLDLLDSAPDEETKRKYELELIRIQQSITAISNTVAAQTKYPFN